MEKVRTSRATTSGPSWTTGLGVTPTRTATLLRRRGPYESGPDGQEEWSLVQARDRREWVREMRKDDQGISSPGHPFLLYYTYMSIHGV